MTKTISVVLLSLFFINLSAQTDDKNNSFGIKFGGFLKTDVMFDSRQTVAAREGHFLLYPEPEKLDLDGEDINATSNLNILSIQSRLTGKITAPDAFGAKVNGTLEGAFFGNTNGDINGFRLRHAFIKLDWTKTTIIIGQYWHPMFITEVFPGVVSFNTGVPFQPFARNPQVRLINKFDNVHLSLTFATQRDFANAGPNGTNCSYLRNSSVPILDLNLKYKSGSSVAGVGFNYKTLKPYLEFNGYKVDDKVTSYSVMSFAKVNLGGVNIKVEGVYGTNLTDVLMLGGYAIHEFGDKGSIEYTATETLSAWTDITFDKKGTFGIFAGYTKNLGTDEINNGTYFSRGSTIEAVWRVSPRIQHQVGKVRLAGELEYTTAAYGSPDDEGIVENTTSVSNLRALVAAYLFF